MDRPITPIRPSASDSSLYLSQTSPSESNHSDTQQNMTPTVLGSIETGPLPEPPRLRAETATSDEIRSSFEAPVERLKRLNDDILNTLSDFEDSSHPRLPDVVYDGLRRCASEMQALLDFHTQPHIMGTEDLSAGDFFTEESAQAATSADAKKHS